MVVLIPQEPLAPACFAFIGIDSNTETWPDCAASRRELPSPHVHVDRNGSVDELSRMIIDRGMIPTGCGFRDRGGGFCANMRSDSTGMVWR